MGGPVCDPGLSTSSNLRTRPCTISDSAATELAQLLGSGTAGELIPELVRKLPGRLGVGP